jgi:hypothetical protein
MNINYFDSKNSNSDNSYLGNSRKTNIRPQMNSSFSNSNKNQYPNNYNNDEDLREFTNNQPLNNMNRPSSYHDAKLSPVTHTNSDHKYGKTK